MNINYIGYNCVNDADYRNSLVGTGGEYLMIVMKSHGIFNIGGKIYPCGPDCVIVFDNTLNFDCRADGEPFIFDWVSFSQDDGEDMLGTLNIPVNRLIRCCDTDLLGAIVKSAESDFYSADPRRAKLLDSHMRTILTRISEVTAFDLRAVRQSADPHYSELLELREQVYRNPQKRWSVDSMAAEVSMSRSYFQHMYREMFGVSCISDVICGKIDRAKELLSETSCTVSQVAAMCGYDNEEHFMRQFKKMVGATPTAYRKKSL